MSAMGPGAPPIRIRDVIHPNRIVRSEDTTVHLHHQAPACRPDLGFGRHRLDGRGGPCRVRPLRRPAPRPASSATASTSPPPGSAARSPARSTRPAATSRLQPDPGHQRGHPRRSLLRRRRQRRTVNTTGSKIHQIGDSPFDGMQRGRAILYINGASGTISGNKVYDFQKNGIEVRGVTADASAPSPPGPPRRSRTTSSPAVVPSTTSPRTAS